LIFSINAPFGQNPKKGILSEVSEVTIFMSKLYFMNGPHEGEIYEVNGKPLVLGRSTKSDIQLNDRFVSRKHLQVKRKRNRVFIKDLHSKNGTLVNGDLIRTGKKLELPERTPVVIGMSVFCLGRECPENIPALLESIGFSRDMHTEDFDPFAHRHPDSDGTVKAIYRISNALKKSLGFGES
jgi:pSer/pThr/pTyr-binding forkhead associated (FHA) protein